MDFYEQLIKDYEQLINSGALDSHLIEHFQKRVDELRSELTED